MENAKKMDWGTTVDKHQACWSNRWYAQAFFTGILLLGVSLVFNYYASIYATERAGNSVQDIVLDNIPVVNVDFIVNEGTGIFGAYVLILLLLKPQRIPFAAKAAALFIVTRSVFITFTHLGPFPYHSFVDPNDIFRMMSFGGDYFFSGHTGFPFLFTLLFWEDRTARLVCLLASLFFGASVLFGHLHYSIDVFAAFYITYGVYAMAKKLFPRDWDFFNASLDLSSFMRTM